MSHPSPLLTEGGAALNTFIDDLRMTSDDKNIFGTFLQEFQGDKLIKAAAHCILNHRDVPKDAVIGSSLRGKDAEDMRTIIRDLYYLKPTCGVCGPGVVGKNHVIENVFKEQGNILTKPKEYPRHAMEIPPQSAHGVSLDVQLGLRYIFTDAGMLPVKYLGKNAQQITYASPSNLIDSATVDTKEADNLFLNIPIQIVASSYTLRRFGIRLTRKIIMYNLVKHRNTSVSLFTTHKITVENHLSERIIMNFAVAAVAAVAIRTELLTKIHTAHFCVEFVLDNTLPFIGNSLPFGNSIFIFYDAKHNEMPIKAYDFGDTFVFSAGNHVKNEILHKIFNNVAPYNLAPYNDILKRFLKYILIELKLLGDANHCIIETQASEEYENEEEMKLLNDNKEQSVLIKDIDIKDDFPGRQYVYVSNISRANSALGTPDYDVILRYNLEKKSCFYTMGMCIEYYAGESIDIEVITRQIRIQKFKNMITMNEACITSMRKFRLELDKDYIEMKGYGLINKKSVIQPLKTHLTSLINKYTTDNTTLKTLLAAAESMHAGASAGGAPAGGASAGGASAGGAAAGGGGGGGGGGGDSGAIYRNNLLKKLEKYEKLAAKPIPLTEEEREDLNRTQQKIDTEKTQELDSNADPFDLSLWDNVFNDYCINNTLQFPVIYIPKKDKSSSWDFNKKHLEFTTFLSIMAGTYPQGAAVAPAAAGGQLPRTAKGLRELVSGSRTKRRKGIIQQSGGAFSDIQRHMRILNKIPGLIPYIILTEYPDIIKFAYAMYLEYGLQNTDIDRIFNIVYNRSELHEFLFFLNGGGGAAAGEGSGGEGAPAGAMMDESGGGGAAAGEGSGGGGAAAAQPHGDADYYSSLFLKICGFALESLLYYNQTHNTSFDDFNKERLHILIDVLVNFIIQLNPPAPPTMPIDHNSPRNGGSPRSPGNDNYTPIKKRGRNAATPAGGAATPAAAGGAATPVAGGGQLQPPRQERIKTINLRNNNLHKAKSIVESLGLFVDEGQQRNIDQIYEFLNNMIIQRGGSYYTVDLPKIVPGDNKNYEINIFDLENSNNTLLLHYLEDANYELTTANLRYRISPITVLQFYLSKYIAAAAAPAAPAAPAAAPATTPAAPGGAPAAPAAPGGAPRPASPPESRKTHINDLPVIQTPGKTSGKTPGQTPIQTQEYKMQLSEEEAEAEAAEAASVAGGAGGLKKLTLDPRARHQEISHQLGKSRKYHNKKTRKSNKPSSSRKSRKV